MEVGKKTILNQFIGGNNSTQFVIPIYQRNYVWEKENIVQLLDDLERMISYIDNEDVFHFLGSIVYIDTLHKGSFNEWTIIDGQQRLTTIFILLQVLKEVFPTYTKGIEKKYLINDEDIINSKVEIERYRLKPLVTDDDVYLKIARNQYYLLNDSDKKTNIYKAYTIIKSTIEQWKEKYSIEDILTALDKFKVVWIQLSKNENPQQVFESINSTGKGLTAADLIRNFVLMGKDDETQTRIYNDYWKKIEFDFVTTSKLKDFFRIYMSIQEKTTIPEREVYDRFKKVYESLLKEYEENKILEQILKYSKYYYIINNICDDKEIEDELKDYRCVKSNMPHIILMETFRLYFDENTISKDDVIKTIKLLTVYITRRNICGLDTKSISNAFGTFLRRIIKYYTEDNLNYYDSVKKAIVADTLLTSQVMPTDKNVKDEFINSNLYSRDSVSFVLKKIENNDNHIIYENLNIEHIMPQTATDFWKTKIKDSSVYEEVVNRIGNLTLVDYRDNSSMSNKNFENKRKSLIKSKHIKLNEDIITKNDWNEDEINNRSAELSEKFIEIFKYPEIQKFDSYLHINVCESNIDDYSDELSGSLPLEVRIDDEVNSNITYWTDLYCYVLKKLYDKDNDSFMKAYTIIYEKYGYKNIQISENIEALRCPVEFSEGVFCETNTSTTHKLYLIKRFIEEMKLDILCEITYMRKEDKI